MHKQGMAHGDLKGVSSQVQGTPSTLTGIAKANILIDENGHARLADFGLLAIIPDTANLVSSNSLTQAGTYRWMSPELLDPRRFCLKHSRPTEHSDCYALGMVVYEVLSGNVPFYRYGTLAAVLRVLEGERPKRPRGEKGAWFNDDIWNILERCWVPTPSDRSKTMDVLVCLEKVSRSLPPSQTMNSDSSVEESTDESEVSLPSHAVPLESLGGLPLGGKPFTVPNAVGAQKPRGPVILPGTIGMVCTFFGPRKRVADILSVGFGRWRSEGLA